MELLTTKRKPNGGGSAIASAMFGRRICQPRRPGPCFVGAEHTAARRSCRRRKTENTLQNNYIVKSKPHAAGGALKFLTEN